MPEETLITIARKIERLESDLGQIKTIQVGHTLGDLIGSWQALPELRGFWPFSSINESGNAIDLSAQARTLTNSGSTTRALTAAFIPYISLNGSSQYFYRASEAGLNISGALTVGCWVYQTTLTSRAFIAKFGASGQRTYYLTNTSGADYQFYVSSNGTALTNVVSTVTPAANAWKFVIGRYNPSTELAIFINNVKTVNTTSIPASLFASTADFRIGVRSDTVEYYAGYIAMPFICASVISDSYLTWLFDMSRSLFGV